MCQTPHLALVHDSHSTGDVVELQQPVVAGQQQPGVRLPAGGREDAGIAGASPKAHRPRQFRAACLAAEPAAAEAVVLQQGMPCFGHTRPNQMCVMTWHSCAITASAAHMVDKAIQRTRLPSQALLHQQP